VTIDDFLEEEFDHPERPLGQGETNRALYSGSSLTGVEAGFSKEQRSNGPF
jgi:hypothetical protein